MKKLISALLAIIMIVTALPVALAAENETVILYTNDVHCAINDYPVLAAYRAELISQGKDVVLVDAGDAIQGEIIGSLTQGEAVVDIMNSVGYDYAVPGNHEFDYGMETFLNLAKNEAEYDYISTNFYYLPSVKPVLAPYEIEDFGDYQVAFVGISTPETITKSTPEYFKDENGNFIYGFPVYPGAMTDDIFYENIQESVDRAINDGADIVVAIGHTGILETTDGWKSTDIIANTDGIDYYIDAHSHETTQSATYKNENNEDVILTSTGTKFVNFGVLTISENNAEFELVHTDDVDVISMTDEAKAAYADVKAKVDGYNEMIADLYEGIGTSEAKLIAYESDNTWAVRKRETNLGDFVADAYRSVTGADVAIVNGGGIRADIESGNVFKKTLMDVNAFNNAMCVIEVTGQQLIDVLEHGARKCPDSSGSFFQVSGITFEIHTYRESPVISDSLGNFIGIDNTLARRVANVYVGGEPIDLSATYTLAGSTYVLTQDGDGLTMLAGSKVVQSEGLPCDSEMLIKYFTETLDGVITEDMYGNPDGDGRITLVEESYQSPEADYEIEYDEKITVTVEPEEDAFVKFVPEKSGTYIFRTAGDGVDTGAQLFNKKSEEIYGEYTDDYGDTLDFVLEYECRAGEAYYLRVFTYSNGTESFELTVECGHTYKDGECTVCGKICDHGETDFLGFCPCGEIYLGTDIADGDEFELKNENSSEIFWFRFTPEESGTYLFKSESEYADPDCVLYDAEGEWVTHSYDVNGMDFELYEHFEAGETYYFSIDNCYDSGEFKVTFSQVTHTADDGSVHTDFSIFEGTPSNCTEHGYTTGLYCNECEEIVSGYEELPLDPEYHIDDDCDDICDLCGEPCYYECDHICHSDNWFMHIIWVIGNFFHKLLGISAECECGELHY